jgi:hypothetical protein
VRPTEAKVFPVKKMWVGGKVTARKPEMKSRKRFGARVRRSDHTRQAVQEALSSW